ncbi:MAG: hypothetical protein LBI02_00300 [Opitutaceae bacterium]|jgi:uncharacterized lipoprotein YajG|nr:hypothetical protein [Opitutaceae bacterium]
MPLPVKFLSLITFALASALLLAACSTPPKIPRGIASSGISPAPAQTVSAAAA